MTVAAVGAVSRAAAGGGAATGARATAAKKTAAKKTAATPKASRGRAGSARGKGSTSRSNPSPGRGGSSSASTTAKQIRQASRDVESAKSTGGTIKKNIVPLRIIKRVNQSGHHLSTGPRRFLVAEFLVCMVLVTIGPLAESRRGEAPATWMKRASAIFGIYFVLGLITTGGAAAAKAAAGFGGIVALAMLVTNRDAITVIGKVVGTDDGPDTTGPSDDITEPDSDPDGPVQPNPRPSPDGGVNPSRPGPDGPA